MFAPEAIEPNVWFQDTDDLLLSSQDVLDYSSFSETSHTASILPADPYEPFYAASNASMDVFSFQEAAVAPTFNFDSETARNAVLLRAYLATQHQEEQQQQWMLAPLSPIEAQADQQGQDSSPEQLTKVQRTDAENLVRYLAQVQQKEENVDHPVMEKEDATAMEHDIASPVGPPSPPSSTASDAGDKSPMTSPTLTRRSLSPEETSLGALMTKAVPGKPTRQLVCFNCKATQTPLWRRTPDRQHSLCNACGLYFKQYGAHRPLNVRHKLSSVLTDVRLSFPYACDSRISSRGSSPTPGSPPQSQDSSASSSSSSDSDSDSGSSSPVYNPLVSIPDLAKIYARALAPSPPTQKTSPPLMTAKQGIQCVNCSQTQTPLWRKNDAGEPICNACGLYAKLHNRDRPITMRKSKITRRRRDWGGNLAHRAQLEAQALANAHAQAQALVIAQAHAAAAQVQVHAQQAQQAQVQIEVPSSRPVPSPTLTLADANVQQGTLQQQQQQQQQQQPTVAQNLSNNVIMDEHRFTNIVGQMNAHQMNRFLSILESRCGVLRERLLASTEVSAHKQPQTSTLDNLF
jgi:ribosomal protein L34E